MSLLLDETMHRVGSIALKQLLLAALVCVPPFFLARADALEPLPPIMSEWKVAPDLVASPQQAALAAAGERRLWRTGGLITAAALGMAAHGAKSWWGDGFTGDFRTINEGWFGQNTYIGGADKLGHAFTGYAGTRLLARGFEWAGNDPDQALRLGFATSVGVLVGVEIMDGFSRKHRFSMEDTIMNVAGAALGVLMEKNPELDRLLDFRLRYWRSEDARRFNQAGFDADYSGQTYLMVVKASGVPALRDNDWLRYFELAVGYGSRGYEPNDGGGPLPTRSRHLYYGVSLNLSEILERTAFRGALKGGRTQRITDTALEFVQIPGTVALADHKL